MKALTNTKVYVFSALAALLLILSGFTYWLSSTIFNQDVFVEETTQVITSDKVTQSISASIVDKSLTEYPVAKRLIGNKLESVVGGLLSTDTFAEVVRGVSGRIYLQITSENPEGVEINTQGVKSLVTPILTVVATPEQKENLEKLDIPDEIVLVDPDSVPSIYYLTNYIWMWPIALLGALGLMGYVVYQADKKSRLKNIQKIAGVVGVTSFIAATIIPSIEPVIVKNIADYNLRVVAGSIYQALSAPLLNIYSSIVIISVLTLVGVFGYQMYMKRQTKKATK